MSLSVQMLALSLLPVPVASFESQPLPQLLLVECEAEM
jgi:hypothetical protein